MAEISLCMIVKNEEKVLGRCLESAKELADEIVIVDTGSEDRTREIAGSYTSLVYEIPWRDDFSQARNFSFSMATKEYCMWLDADDVISEENRRKLLEYKGKMDGTEDVVMIKYTAGFDAAGRPSFTYYRERILRNREDLRWKGRVHEAVEPRGNVVYWDAAIFHRKEGPGEPGRNLRIYEKMRAAGEVFGPRELFYYGRELMYGGRTAEAVKVLEEFLEREDGWTENRIEACENLDFCFRSLGKREEGLRALLRSLSGELLRDRAAFYGTGGLGDSGVLVRGGPWKRPAGHGRRIRQGGLPRIYSPHAAVRLLRPDGEAEGGLQASSGGEAPEAGVGSGEV